MPAQKPTSLSVTSTPCTCRWLQSRAAEPDDPVVFDGQTQEYHISKPKGGYLVIYHCPFCGGAAPRSKRDELFAHITDAEAHRLQKVTEDLKTVKQAVRVLGTPDTDMPRGLIIHTPAKGRTPPQIASYRTLTFTKLSKTADVHLMDYGPQGIRFRLQGKYVGELKRPPNNRMQRTRAAKAKRPGGPRR